MDEEMGTDNAWDSLLDKGQSAAESIGSNVFDYLTRRATNALIPQPAPAPAPAVVGSAGPVRSIAQAAKSPYAKYALVAIAGLALVVIVSKYQRRR